jgi:hypothetical protein
MHSFGFTLEQRRRLPGSGGGAREMRSVQNIHTHHSTQRLEHLIRLRFEKLYETLSYLWVCILNMA